MVIVQQKCPGCGLADSDWQGADGRGYTKDGLRYCCSGCAEDAGCTCA